MSLSYGFCLGDDETEYTSKEFSRAIQAVFGDGVCSYGTQFALTLRSGLEISVGSGYALAAGRFLKLDEPIILALEPPSNTEDRFDSVVVREDEQERRAVIEVVSNVSQTAPRPENGIVLYLIRVRRGATSLSTQDITDTRSDPDLCGNVKPLSDASRDILRVYNFLNGGIDQEVDRLIALSNQVIAKADSALTTLNVAVLAAGGTAVGDLMTSAVVPAPASEWLLCDGSSVPAQYPVLSELLNGTLPNIPQERVKTYIYSGTPT